ncbi:MAG: hypothetical protein ACXAE3_09760 [Candidatus Kariarchaeaceae archaeon]|jgi:hypothetical protein
MSVDYKVPAGLRFIMELFSWIWMVIAQGWIILIISVLSLALLNVPGDKKPVSERVIGIPVPGLLRIFVELGTAIIGVLTAFWLVGWFPGLLQLGIVAMYLKTDGERLKWFAGLRSDIPEYMLELHKASKRN